MRCLPVCLAVLAALAAPCIADEVLMDFEDLTECNALGAAEINPAPGVAGASSAMQVTMPGRANCPVGEGFAPEAWDAYEGVSFQVKGDGSQQWGSIALMGAGANRGHSYRYHFPLASTEWLQYQVAWADWIPEGAYGFIGETGALPPSGIGTIRIGDRWIITHNNAKIPRHTYTVDDLRLEESLPDAEPAPTPAPLADVTARLRSKLPVRIVCIGDSLTAGTTLPDRDRQRYATALQTELRVRLGYDGVLVESRAVGGSKLADARAWINRDFQDAPPDLITILYGYNDKTATSSASEFASSLDDYLTRLCRVTHGQSALLPMTTLPGQGPRFVMMDDFAQAVRDVSTDWGLRFCDLHAAFKPLGREGLQPIMNDMAHPNPEGHRRIAATIAAFLTAGGKPTVRRTPPIRP